MYINYHWVKSLYINLAHGQVNCNVVLPLCIKEVFVDELLQQNFLTMKINRYRPYVVVFDN